MMKTKNFRKLKLIINLIFYRIRKLLFNYIKNYDKDREEIGIMKWEHEFILQNHYA